MDQGGGEERSELKESRQGLLVDWTWDLRNKRERKDGSSDSWSKSESMKLPCARMGRTTRSSLGVKGAEFTLEHVP